MKDIGYYMSLPYRIMVREFSEEDGGGVLLSIPQLGEAAVNAYGDTYTEARDKLERIKKDLIEIWLDAGIDIPEPQDELQCTANLLNDTKVCFQELGGKFKIA